MPTRSLADAGTILIAKPAHKVKTILLDPSALLSLVPNALHVRYCEAGNYEGELTFGVGRLQGRYSVLLTVFESEPLIFDVRGTSRGRFGGGEAVATVRLHEVRPSVTRIDWCYKGQISGGVSLIGTRIQRLASRSFIDRFFKALAACCL